MSASSKKLTLTGLLLFVFSLSLMSFLVFYLDDTSFISGNGNYKSLQFKAYLNPIPEYHWKTLAEAWEANALYVPVGSFLIKYFLFFTDVSILKKMAMVNVIFGSIALVLFFLLVYEITSSKIIALFAALFHLACSSFLTLATTSEDIVPAYSLYVGGVLFLHRFLKSRKISSLILCSVLFTFSWLLHWTMILAILPAMVVCLLVNKDSWKERIKNIGLFFSVQLIITLVMSFVLDGNVRRLWFPEKGVHTSYLGITLDKILTQLFDKPLYTTGGFAYHYSYYLDSITTSYLVLYILNLLFLLWLTVHLFLYLKKEWKINHDISFWIFLFVVFIMGGSLGFYDRPNMQYELQPMMLVPLAFGLLIWNSAGLQEIKLLHYFKFIFPVILLVLNFIPRFESKGTDSLNLNTVKEIEEAVKTPHSVLFILSGWDDFTIWSPINLDLDKHYQMLTLVELLEWHFDDTDEQILAFMDSTIQTNLKEENQIIQGSFMDDGLEKMTVSFGPFQQPERVKLIYNYLNDNFLSEEIADTHYGKYYRLTPK